MLAGFAVISGRLSDHHDRLWCRGDSDASFLVLDLKLIPDMEAQGFEPFSFHLDFWVIGVAAAVHIA